MAKLRFKDHKGQRYLKQYRWIEADYSEETGLLSAWYNCDLNRWEATDKEGKRRDPNAEYSSSCWCNSVKAFRRKLKKMPKGIKFRLISKFVGVGDVYGVGTGEAT